MVHALFQVGVSQEVIAGLGHRRLACGHFVQSVHGLAHFARGVVNNAQLVEVFRPHFSALVPVESQVRNGLGIAFLAVQALPDQFGNFRCSLCGGVGQEVFAQTKQGGVVAGLVVHLSQIVRHDGPELRILAQGRQILNGGDVVAVQIGQMAVVVLGRSGHGGLAVFDVFEMELSRLGILGHHAAVPQLKLVIAAFFLVQSHSVQPLQPNPGFLVFLAVEKILRGLQNGFLPAGTGGVIHQKRRDQILGVAVHEFDGRHGPEIRTLFGKVVAVVSQHLEGALKPVGRCRIQPLVVLTPGFLVMPLGRLLPRGLLTCCRDC